MGSEQIPACPVFIPVGWSGVRAVPSIAGADPVAEAPNPRYPPPGSAAISQEQLYPQLKGTGRKRKGREESQNENLLKKRACYNIIVPR
jgi:hypothetical protein